jgi:hypothetical protein
MVVTRSGKNTNRYEVPTLVCGHKCTSWHQYCCACSDIRPIQRVYTAHNRSNLCEVSYVSRSHYYCPTCKLAPPPVKIDFSKMKPKPISAPIIFHPTTEYKLAEAEKRIKELEDGLEKLAIAFKNSDDQLQVWKEQYRSAVNINNLLCERIRNPFKSAISRPNF